MPTPRKPPARTIILNFPESLYAELMLLRSDTMINSQGNTKYGAITGYFVRLCREDLEKRKEEIRRGTFEGKTEEKPS